MASNVSGEESQQLLRTVEMFEAITESQSDDYQSLEILKEAYNKLGRQADSLRVSKKLASAYLGFGQISQAILEYEGLLQEYPDDQEIRVALEQLTAKTKFATTTTIAAPPLAEDSKPKPPAGVPAGVSALSDTGKPTEDGDQALAKVLIAEKVLTPQATDSLMQKLKASRVNTPDKSQQLTLLQLLANEQIAKADDLLTIIAEKSGLAYMPLSTYDVDRDIVCLVPQDICWQHCIVPFDLISRSVLIATANPFDHRARKQIEAMVDYNIFWYVTWPTEIITTLRRAHGLESNRTPQARP